jgi:hypothetical protein
MYKILLRPIVFFSSILFFTSCTSTRFGTKNELVVGPDSNYIARHEVSVGDWITYIVSTSFTDDQATISLGDHRDKLESKLPALNLGGWSHYTLKAFLRNSQKKVTVDFYDDCKEHLIKIAVAETAWDSIKKYALMDIPIAGITYEKAMEYLAYKQDILTSCSVSDKEKYRYECFLPTPEEFETIQTVMDSLNTKGCNLFNYKNSLCEDCENRKKFKNHPVLSKTGKEPTYIWFYYPDPLGLKNFKGNVSEMTSTKGVAIGGSCMHYAAEAFNGRRQTYSGAAAWLGMRVWYRIYRRVE